MKQLTQTELRSIIDSVMTEAKKKKAPAKKSPAKKTASKKPTTSPDDLVKQVEDAVKTLIKLTPRVMKYFDKLSMTSENDVALEELETVSDSLERFVNGDAQYVLSDIRSKVALAKRKPKVVKSKPAVTDDPKDHGYYDYDVNDDEKEWTEEDYLSHDSGMSGYDRARHRDMR